MLSGQRCAALGIAALKRQAANGAKRAVRKPKPKSPRTDGRARVAAQRP